MNRGGYIYILTNKHHNVFYIGVTSDLKLRMEQHKSKMNEGFTKKYNVTILVYYEMFNHIEEAIAREKILKGGSRAKKITLIEKNNPEYVDLTESIILY